MSAIQHLQNLAGKIEELKEKLSSEEYKDLLELSHKYYDIEKEKQEKRKPRILVEVMVMNPVVHYATSGAPDWDDDFLSSTSTETHIHGSDSEGDCIENFKVHIRPTIRQEKKLYEVCPESSHSDFTDLKMTEMTYDILKKEKIVTRCPDEILVYLGERIINV
jgi:hypothetical protein|tara:strand:+ start:1762 stop:2250 length:489 start_codon:yes stop_codon:yes gene_type:complete